MPARESERASDSSHMTAAAGVWRFANTGALRLLAAVTLGGVGTQVAQTQLGLKTSASERPEPSDQKDPGLTFAFAALSRQGLAPGYKSFNQDAFMAEQPFWQPGCAVFGAMDGHGAQGERVSRFISQHLPSVLTQHLESGQTAQEALRTAIPEVDEQMQSADIETYNSGSTAVVAVLQGRQLTTAWAGDSRAVIGTRSADNQSWVCVSLTYDHKPDSEGERTRIVKAGGRVEQTRGRMGFGVGPSRVWLPDVDYPGLAMSRALGDRCLRDLGVICNPDTKLEKITRRDGFLILATDGVFEYLTNQQVVELVGKTLEQEGAWSDPSYPASLPLSHEQETDSHTHSNNGHNSHTKNTHAPQGKRALIQAAPVEAIHADNEDVGSGVVGGTAGGSAALRRGAARACAKLVAAARDRWMQAHRGMYVDDITAVVVAFQQQD